MNIKTVLLCILILLITTHAQGMRIHADQNDKYNCRIKKQLEQDLMCLNQVGPFPDNVFTLPDAQIRDKSAWGKLPKKRPVLVPAHNVIVLGNLCVIKDGDKRAYARIIGKLKNYDVVLVEKIDGTTTYTALRDVYYFLDNEV